MYLPRRLSFCSATGGSRVIYFVPSFRDKSLLLVNDGLLLPSWPLYLFMLEPCVWVIDFVTCWMDTRTNMDETIPLIETQMIGRLAGAGANAAKLLEIAPPATHNGVQAQAPGTFAWVGWEVEKSPLSAIIGHENSQRHTVWKRRI